MMTDKVIYTELADTEDDEDGRYYYSVVQADTNDDEEGEKKCCKFSFCKIALLIFIGLIIIAGKYSFQSTTKDY